jgi:N utilization substance protein A
MATNKTNKKLTKPKRYAGKKGKPLKKTVKKNLAKKRGTPKKKLAKKEPALKKAVVKTKALGQKTTGTRTPTALGTRVRGKSQSVDTEAFAPEALRERSGGQSGDLQGLSNIEGADSESVAELIEEGNAFEADAVAGVEHAGDTDQKEVRTHEVPQDDVPSEYRDKE